jgi:hypothetical protein
MTISIAKRSEDKTMENIVGRGINCIFFYFNSLGYYFYSAGYWFCKKIYGFLFNEYTKLGFVSAGNLCLA